MKLFLLILICSILVYSGGLFFDNDIHASPSDMVTTLERDDGWEASSFYPYHEV